MKNDKLPMPQNYTKQVEWVINAYENAGVNLANGFQKDDIQNHQGARKSNNKWDNWNCSISLEKNEKGLFLVCEDFGTVGLTGENMSVQMINEKVAKNEQFDPEERLARFSSMYNSGGNKAGGGLYGVGKSVYSVASKDNLYYYDSLREDGIYVANSNDKGQIFKFAYEGEKAKDFIKNETGFDSKKTVGTRVIIKNPKQDIIEAIESGEMEQYIQESWWMIIDRLPDNAGIYVNSEKIKVPEDIKDTDLKFELSRPIEIEEGYRIKKFGLYVFKEGDNKWNGISYYRKGMKIGNIDINKEIPEKIRNNYWGFVEVDEKWESELEEIEDAVHFGVNKNKKLTKQYQNLKKFCESTVRKQLIEWGFIKDKEHEDEKLNAELNQIAEEIQDLFENLGLEDLGKGPQKADFDVRWKNIEYPTEESLTVTSGDKINFTARITSRYLTDKTFEYSFKVFDHVTKQEVTKIDGGEFILAPQEIKELKYNFKIDEESAAKYSENRIILVVKVTGSGKSKRKELPFFFDCEKPEEFRENVGLSLHSCVFPTEGSRRVNFDEELTAISYAITNNRREKLDFRLNISIHVADKPNIVIDKVASIDGTVNSFEDIVITDIPSIAFYKEKYSKYMEKGTLQLRARLIALSSSGEFRKGDKITYYNCNIYLNCDEKNGKRDSFEPISKKDPDNYKRSWVERSGGNRFLVLNVGHNAYTRLEQMPEIQHEYIHEEMLKQYVLLYLEEGKYDMFGGEDDFSDMDPVTASEQVINKIEEIYYESLM